MPAIEVTDLRRTYRTTTGFFRRGALDVEAVRGITFDVDHGELFGLLGPNEAGKTVLLTTHYMFEADALCDRVAVITRGEIVAEGPPKQLKALVAGGLVVEIEVYGIPEVVLNEVRRVAGVRSVAVEERDQAQVIVVSVEPGEEVTPALLAPLNGTNVGRVAVREPTLEDAYVALVAEE